MPSIVTQKDRLRELEAAKSRERAKESCADWQKEKSSEKGSNASDSKDRVSSKDVSTSKDKSKHHHKSSHRASRSHHKARRAGSPDASGSDGPERSTRRRASMPENELKKGKSIGSEELTAREGKAYPSFSKAHSREAVRRSPDDDGHDDYLTPEPTDLEDGGRRTKPTTPRRVTVEAPPSPPETTLEDRARMASPKVEIVKPERKKSELQKAAEEIKRRLLRSSSTNDIKKSRSVSSSKLTKDSRDSLASETPPSSTTRLSKSGTPSKKTSFRTNVINDAEYPMGSPQTQSAASGAGQTDSDVTSIAPNQHLHTDRRGSKAENESNAGISPKPLSRPFSSSLSHLHGTNAAPKTPRTPHTREDGNTTPVLEHQLIPPPPPPIPLELAAPRVDYLMRYGGLNCEVPKTIVSAQGSAQGRGMPTVAQVFGPFNELLGEYGKVMARNGSMAVATGYRSIARRLLDRLETVFARDLSSERCDCASCFSKASTLEKSDDRRGISWGEVLEYVSGRQVLPQWPPLIQDGNDTPTMSEDKEHEAPMQKLDIDVPEEFRAHYIRQSRKTKMSVDRWLDGQTSTSANAPQDVDDETLTFAILTRLQPDQRILFQGLLGIAASRPASVAPSALPNLPNSSHNLRKSAVAIQRLYRLRYLPRDPEVALYMLQYPHLHDVLATLAAVSDHEWEILVSGRFDGFLRSGAVISTDSTDQGSDTGTPHLKPTISRSSKFASISSPPPLTRPEASSTPLRASSATQGPPVSLDEETEIAALAEIEREIYTGMEALEDAFEALHSKAEIVRTALRQRAAGLVQSSQRRRCDSFSSFVDLDTGPTQPSSPAFDNKHGMSRPLQDIFQLDDASDDWGRELAPDDSASNISRSRHRRPKRRTERRTPAPVEEGDEDV